MRGAEALAWARHQHLDEHIRRIVDSAPALPQTAAPIVAVIARPRRRPE